MLDSLKRFFRERVLDAPPAEAGDPGRRLRLAAAALLVEVMRADPDVKEEERTVVRTALQGTFGLSLAETEELVRLAEAEADAATSLYEFTSLLADGFSREERKRIVELMWLVAFADAEKHPLEEHLIRRLAGLLKVPHPDFIDAKIRAREESRT
ncbi:MAG: TerB family tellurite resistance protein [Thermoanaerobaculia bacterium]|jgi:uncharacterized tellurite resistance protein B-like protein|nr:TerB family tellurite resistance protein [Thermoanaerobaculia bacterium]